MIIAIYSSWFDFQNECIKVRLLFVHVWNIKSATGKREAATNAPTTIDSQNLRTSNSLSATHRTRYILIQVEWMRLNMGA